MNSIMEQIKKARLAYRKGKVFRDRRFFQLLIFFFFAKVGDAVPARRPDSHYSLLCLCSETEPSLPFPSSPAVMKLNLCAELASHTSLKTSGWIKHGLVISQGLDPCHAHINYYRGSICDCPSVALATY